MIRKILPILALLLALLIALLIVLITGCRQEEPPEYAIDPAALAADLAAGLTFDDQLIPLTDEAVAVKFPYGQQKAAAWAGSGATAELILVAEFADEEAARAALERSAAYRKGQADLFAKYAADEVPKLEGALEKTLGRWLIVAVCPDPAAADALLTTLAAPVNP